MGAFGGGFGCGNGDCGEVKELGGGDDEDDVGGDLGGVGVMVVGLNREDGEGGRFLGGDVEVREGDSEIGGDRKRRNSGGYGGGEWVVILVVVNFKKKMEMWWWWWRN